MRSRGPRPLRAVLLGLAAVVLGLGAHDAARVGAAAGPAAAHLPALVGVGLGAAAVTALVDRFGGVTRTAGALGAFSALGAGQVVLHLATGDGGGTQRSGAAARNAEHGGMAGHAMAGMSPAAHLLSPAMLTAHVLVTLAVTAGIAGAEATVAAVVTLSRTLADLARRIRRRTRLLPLAAPPRRPAVRPVPVAGHGTRGAPGVVAARIHPLRGPPLPS